jgi:hypothetical protein
VTITMMIVITLIGSLVAVGLYNAFNIPPRVKRLRTNLSIPVERETHVSVHHETAHRAVATERCIRQIEHRTSI